MVNDLRDLLRESVASPPPDPLDVPTLLAGGRRRLRRRRVGALVGTALATAGVVATASVVSLGGGPDTATAGVPRPDGPVLRLADAERATEGTDYRVLTSYTNDNLDRDNGQYLDGVTEDGLVLFRDGPREGQWWPRYALLDPATGTKEWLPRLDIGQTQAWPLQLGAERLTLLTADGGMDEVELVMHVFDRRSGQWSRVAWPGLPKVGDPFSAQVGPDGRLYVRVPATKGEPPPGGWPTDASGEADDADAEGDTYHLWSASMTDPSDVRDEGLTVGSLAFGDHTMVWTDSTNGDAGQVHVRDLDTGQEHAFDPHTGEKCNLLGFGATDERVVMSQYCGTYDDGVRDDRVQVLDTAGRQVVTLQDSGMDGGLATAEGPGVVTLTSYESGTAGTYAYDLGSGRLLRLTDSVAKFAAGGPTEGREFLYSTPVNHRHGMVQHVAELLD